MRVGVLNRRDTVAGRAIQVMTNFLVGAELMVGTNTLLVYRETNGHESIVEYQSDYARSRNLSREG